MHRLTDIVISTEGERQVAHATTDVCTRQILFDPSGSLDKIHRIIIMFLNTRSHSQYIRVENDIMRIKIHLFCQYFISTGTDFNLTFKSICLSFFIESHHYNGSSQFFYQTGMFYKYLLPFLQRNRIDNGLSLQAFQSGLNDFPLGRVNHDRYTGYVGFGHDQIQESSHLLPGIQQTVIHIYINHQSTVFHLLASDT